MRLGGTEPKPRRLAKSPDGLPTVALNARESTKVPVTAAGHIVRGDEPAVPVPPSEAIGNVGREAAGPARWKEEEGERGGERERDKGREGERDHQVPGTRATPT